MNTTGRLLAFAVLAACVCPSIAAQSESFADFRKKVLSDFNDFRSSVLENYDKVPGKTSTKSKGKKATLCRSLAPHQP